jgi:hypothetical protein
MFLGLFAIIGDTAVRPLRWGALATTLTIVYTWLLLSWQNFVELIWIPAWNTIMAKEPVTVFGLGAVIFVVGILFYVLMMIRTALISWSRDGIPYLAI